MITRLESIDRDALDDLALTSQARAALVIEEDRFKGSLITVHNDDGSVAMNREEFPRPGTTKEGFNQLKTVFSMCKDIPINDQDKTYGLLVEQRYPALFLTSKAFADANDLKLRACIVTVVNMGDDPTLMFNAQGPAAKKALARARPDQGRY